MQNEIPGSQPCPKGFKKWHCSDFVGYQHHFESSCFRRAFFASMFHCSTVQFFFSFFVCINVPLRHRFAPAPASGVQGQVTVSGVTVMTEPLLPSPGPATTLLEPLTLHGRLEGGGPNARESFAVTLTTPSTPLLRIAEVCSGGERCRASRPGLVVVVGGETMRGDAAHANSLTDPKPRPWSPHVH